MSIYIKPSQTARQRDWVALTADNFASLVTSAYTNYQKRTKDSRLFEIYVFELAAKKERRTLPGPGRHELQVADITRAHWSIYHARQPKGSTLTPPDTATFAQAQYLDAMLAEEKVEEESEYGTVNARIDGSREIPITFNIQELGRVMQLSNYNLLASGVFSSSVPLQEPDEDVEYLDYASD
ncbi:hypothetical protein GN958_ATG09467 [Phytophthora infestans]|uniref:Uncharacterized protein n=1 Tax=Phytophthora infestans TaxID=4787 RepID=A0A8S9UKR6_PHYIN|nr:hypothetical protein GN958_ATG09467 [Phytophthora infestans]